jgi:hypothetical protein
MAHEELQRQYEKDCKNHERPWELWELFDPFEGWVTLFTTPAWSPSLKYRRKEQPFEPECFSGLNCQRAERLVGTVVEVSDDGGEWSGPFKLVRIRNQGYGRRFETAWNYWEYIRTAPETHAHPTITIGGVKLPRPEVDVPERGAEYWVWTPKGILHNEWHGSRTDKEYFLFSMIHLTEDRAQAWASWWENAVMAAVRGGE